MNSILSFVLAVLVYPGVLVALVGGVALAFARNVNASQGQVASEGEVVGSPLHLLAGFRTHLATEWASGVRAAPVELLASAVAVLAPFLALVLVPFPGNPLVKGVGLTTDLAAEGALLLGVPFARLLLGWGTPDAGANAAADRGARLLGGAVLPMAIALTVAAESMGTMSLQQSVPLVPTGIVDVIARVLAAATFVCVVPALARTTPIAPVPDSADSADQTDTTAYDELQVLTGQGRAAFTVASMLQLASVSAVFVAAFLLPLAGHASATVVGVIWIVGLLATAVLVGFWENRYGFRPRGMDRPPLSWWAGIPTLLALGSLVAIAWATRGV